MTSAAIDRRGTRRGFTLIELLVVMALIAGLAAIAMVVAPSAVNKDRTASAVSQIQGALQIARARAVRDGLPRGVRFIYNPAPGKPNPNLVTEYQYIEVAPMFVPNPGGPLGVAPYAPTTPPYVEFTYSPTTGAVNSRTCRIHSLDGSHQVQVFAGGTLYLPTLGTWHRIISATPPSATMTVTLDTYPDQQLGAETHWRTYHFGLNGGPRTLLGEPTLQLPQGTCVDLAQSQPPGGGGQDYDILFTPSGLLTGGSTQGLGQVFLLVRDPNKGNPIVSPSPNPATYSNAGEMLVVSIKAKTGGIGAAPVDWSADPFSLAKKSLSGQ
ncbi:pilus assembly FimT family protein [Gemmata sp.]|uniref:pilus assembly FimT family protein n=1 Tax=Gemmata sp. TaxID=1914242 RepID=UPI003F727071